MAPSYSEETIRLTNGEWAPFLSENANHYGYYSHIVTEAFKQVDIKTEYGFFPWQRSIFYAKKSKKWDGGIAFSITDKREKSYIFSDAIAESCVVLFHLKKHAFNWSSTQDFQKLKFGGTAGYNTLEKLQKIKQSGVPFSIETAISDQLNFRKLVAERINIFPCNLEVGLGLIQQEFPSDIAKSITYSKKKFYCDSYHIGFPKQIEKSKYWLKKFNLGLKLLHKSGKYKRLNDA